MRREAYGTPLLPLDILEISDDITPPDMKAARGEFQSHIAKMVERMTPLEREIIVLVHIEELTIREAAAEIGINLEAAKNAIAAL